MHPALSANILVPAAVLVIWSLVMLMWMVATRMPALKAAKVDISTARGGRGQDLEKILPPSINWISHNYAHLMEQPTIYYPTVILLAVLGQGTPLNLALAWGYTGIRILHSLWQAKVNSIPVRVALFFASTLLLVILAINAFFAAMAAADY